MTRLPLYPAHPERICWGCSQFCRSDDLACGNGCVRTPHPQELFGEQWVAWAEENDIAVGGPDPSGALDASAPVDPERVSQCVLMPATLDDD